MPIFIPFLIKGAIIAGKAIIATKKVTTVAKVATMAAHTYGTATVVGAAATGCVVIGGIVWSVDRIDDLKDCYDTWERGDTQGLLTKFASLLSKVNSVAGHSFETSAVTLLRDEGYNTLDVAKFIKDSFDIVNDSYREVKRS